jgi:hypothetical protein
MLTGTNNSDIIVKKWIVANDPFQFAEPCWYRQTLNRLPQETFSTVNRDELRRRDLMAIRTIQESEAPVRMFKRSGISNTGEFSDVLTAMRTVRKDQALVITLESKSFLDGSVKKPEVTFAYTLRRYFAKNGIMATAYMSAKNEVTIRHATEAPKVVKRPGKK